MDLPNGFVVSQCADIIDDGARAHERWWGCVFASFSGQGWQIWEGKLVGQMVCFLWLPLHCLYLNLIVCIMCMYVH